MHPQALFNLFGKGVYLYGICIGIGLVTCILFFFYFTKKRNMPQNVQDFSFFVAIGAIALGFLFAKLFQTFYNWIDTGKWNFYSAGITVMGGLIGGAVSFIALYFLGGKLIFKGNLSGIHLKHFKTILIVAPLCILIAHAFGRIGCLTAGCCHGTYLGKEYVFGGIYMKGGSGWGFYVPTQLYEALFLFIAFAVLSYLLIKKNATFTMPAYLISYGVFRFVIEFVRDDYRGFSGFMSPSQWTSVIFILIGLGYIAFMVIKKIPFIEKPMEVESVASDLDREEQASPKSE